MGDYDEVATEWDEAAVRRRLVGQITDHDDHYDLDAAVDEIHAAINALLADEDIFLGADGTVVHPVSLARVIVTAKVDQAVRADWSRLLERHRRTRPARATAYTIAECTRLLEISTRYCPPYQFATDEAGPELHASLNRALPVGYTLDHDGLLHYPGDTPGAAVEQIIRDLGSALASSDILGILRKHPVRPRSEQLGNRRLG